MKTRILLLAMMIAVVTAPTSKAGIGDPWWLLYTVNGGTLLHKKGPYNSRIQCQGARYTLKFGQKYVDCAQ